jgi:hypothetical protein
MAIIAAFITASVALLVPFITFYLNRSSGLPAAGQAGGRIDVTVTPSVRLVIVMFVAVFLALPVGFLTFCVAVVGNLFLAPEDFPVFLFSLDAGLTGGAIFAISLIWHGGFNEPRAWWTHLRWYPAVVTVFFASLGFVGAFASNTIFALAVGLPLENAHLLHDTFDAAVASAVVAPLAAFGTVKIEELREGGARPAIQPAE